MSPYLLIWACKRLFYTIHVLYKHIQSSKHQHSSVKKSESTEQHPAGLAIPIRTVQPQSASQTLSFSDTSSQWGTTKGIGT